MKLTWFGGKCLRVYIGGEIVVFDPTGGSPSTDHTEVVSGADQIFERSGPYENADPKLWRPRRISPLDEAARGPVRVYIIGFEARLIDAAGEPPLVLMGNVEGVGNWARDAVVIAFSQTHALAAVKILSPRLIALALPESELDGAIAQLSSQLNGTSLVSLEPGLALEV